MNVVVCKHPNDNGKYLFEVPKDEALFAGDYVLVSTKKSPSEIALCITDSFVPEDPEAIAKLWGSNTKTICPVVAKLYKDEFVYEAKAEETQENA